MSNDLVIEGIYKECPFPTPAVAFEYRHIGYNDFNRTGCVPVSFDLVGKLYVFLPRLLVGVFPCFGADTSLLAAFVCQIVGEHPTRSLKYCFGKHVITMRGMLFVLLHQQLCKELSVLFVAIQCSATTSPPVITGLADTHDLTQEYHGGSIPKIV